MHRRQANQEEEKLIAMALMVMLFTVLSKTSSICGCPSCNALLKPGMSYLAGAQAVTPWVSGRRGRITPERKLEAGGRGTGELGGSTLFRY